MIMIRSLIISGVILIAASAAGLAQTSDSKSTQTAVAVPCPLARGPRSKAGHRYIAVSPDVMASAKIGGKDPKYPSDAKKARIEGTVKLGAIISESGTVEDDVCVISGPEILQQAAVDAVKTWTYKPVTVRGQPLEVMAQIYVDFKLRD